MYIIASLVERYSPLRGRAQRIGGLYVSGFPIQSGLRTTNIFDAPKHETLEEAQAYVRGFRANEWPGRLAILRFECEVVETEEFCG